MTMQDRPAFPRQPVIGPDEERPHRTTWWDEGHEGMSTLDYFIAHAPAKPWAWFKPVMPPKPTAPEMVGNNGEAPNDEEYRRITDWRYDMSWDLDLPNFSYYAKAVSDYYEEKSQWDEEYKKQLDIQWPIFWAKTMLSQRQAQQGER